MRDDSELILWPNDSDRVEWDVETDVLVIGCGGCGLVAALAAAEQGATVTDCGKGSQGRWQHFAQPGHGAGGRVGLAAGGRHR